MKKTIYVSPRMEVCMIQGQVLLNAISSASTTNVEGLGVSTESYEGEGRVKSQGYNVWDDDWSK